MAALNRLGSTWSSSAWRSKSPIALSRLSSSIDMMELYELPFVESRPFGNNSIKISPLRSPPGPPPAPSSQPFSYPHPSPATGPSPDTLFPAFSPAVLLAPSPGHQTHSRHPLPSPSPRPRHAPTPPRPIINTGTWLPTPGTPPRPSTRRPAPSSIGSISLPSGNRLSLNSRRT